MPRKRGAAAAYRDEKGDIRLTLDVPKPLHKRLKIHCAKNTTTIREFICYLLEKNMD